MSRTKRNYETWRDWIPGAAERLSRGLVEIPKIKPETCSEIWHPSAKRFRRRTLNRANRRIARKLCEKEIFADIE